MPTKKKITTTKRAPADRKKRVSRKKAAPRKRASTKKATPASSVKKTVATRTLTLDSVVVINDARSLYQTLAEIYNDSDVTIDASAVEMIDTAVLQLLFAFTKKVQAGNHQISWKNPSDEFVSRADLLGLSHHLGIN
ncbi:MAG: STAS domain-containing protein [Gammaproteobacteria bacterium]|nr:STAS domain-containing protein [Gammaproteobacteria bacterium]